MTTRLAQVLEEQGRKKSWLADQLRVNRSTVTRWVQGTTVPRNRHKRMIADLLGVAVERLFG